MIELDFRNNALWYRGKSGKRQKVGLKSLQKLNKGKELLNHLKLFCFSDNPRTLASKVTKISSIFSAGLDDNLDFPNEVGTEIWQKYINDLLESWIKSSNSNAKIETRVKYWNKHLQPFLVYLQQKHFIPVAVFLNKVPERFLCIKSEDDERVIGESAKSSFRIQQSIKGNSQELQKLIATIDASQTTQEYLDAFVFDLEKKLKTYVDALELYWSTIKAHFDYGCRLLDELTNEEESGIDARISSKNYMTCISRGKNIPPLRKHVYAVRDEKSFASLLYVCKKLEPSYHNTKSPEKPYFPNDTISAQIKKNGFDPFLDGSEKNLSFIPKISLVSLQDRVNWCIGKLAIRDVAYLIALIVIKCPKFNFEPLLFSKFVDKHGLSIFTEIDDDGNKSFSVDKKRGQSIKTEALDKVSRDVFEFLHQIQCENEKFKQADIESNFVFLVRNRAGTNFTLPATARVISYLTGNQDKAKTTNNQKDLSAFFPSLKKDGLGKGSVSFKSIRATIAVLEWHKTGSIKCASKKIGNSEKILLESYIPKSLINIVRERMVRLFQSSMVLASTIHEPNLLMKASGLRSESELNKVIEEISEQTGLEVPPLLSPLIFDAKDKQSQDSKLIGLVSANSLARLYAFRDEILRSKKSYDEIKKVRYSTGINAYSLYQFANMMDTSLCSHRDPKYQLTNSKAKELSRSVSFLGIESFDTRWGSKL